MLTAVLVLAHAVTAEPGPKPQLIVGGGSRIEWIQVLSSPGNDWINDLVQLSSGHIAAAGFLDRRDDPPSDWSAVLAEFRPDGSRAGETRYGEGSGIDAIFGMLGSRDGLVLAGFTTRIGAGGIDALSLITRADGSVVREEAHGGPGYDRFTDVAAATDGYVFLGHSQADQSDKRRVFLVKTDRTGRKLWERILDAPESWGALYIEPAAGGFIIAGGTSAGGDRDMFALKVDEDGRELWRKRAGTGDWDEVNHGLVLRNSGEIVLVGYTNRGDAPNDVVAATLSSEGDVVRLERWGGNGDDRPILARAGPDGRIWIAGHTASAGAGGDDAFLTSLNSRGEFEGGVITIGGEADDRGTAVLPMPDGKLVVAGYSRSLGDQGEDAFVAKLAAPSGATNPAFRREVVQPR